MAAQPIYPDEFHYEMDRLYGRLTDYVDAQIGKAIVQMRVDRTESRMRDETLLKRVEAVEATQASMLKRIETIEATQTAIIDMQRKIIEAQTVIIERLDNLAEQMRDGFAAQGERISELAMRVERLERGDHPSNNE